MTRIIQACRLLFSSIGICFLLFQEAAAQCPQRYRDPVFSKVNARLNNKYGIEKMNTEGTKTWQAFDLYEPKDDTALLRPLIVLIHGGGFTNWPPLDRTSPEIAEIGKDLAKRGYVVVSPEYRLYSGDATYDKMVETVMAAAFDINDLMCYLANSTGSGNPFRIDTSRCFLGGSSAGALLALNFGLYINDTSDLNPELRRSMNIVSNFDHVNPQTILQHKFCGIEPKGIIAISGSLIDTNLVQPRTGNVLLIHGKRDGAIPYMYGHPLGNPVLPLVYGPGTFMEKMWRNGLHVEADIYDDKYHVPVLHPFGDSIQYALQLLLQTGSVFDAPILDSTERHIARFCYNILGSPATSCLTTGIRQQTFIGQVKIAPNPSNGRFELELPSVLCNKKLKLMVYDVSGQSILEESITSNGHYPLQLDGQPKGIYWLYLSEEHTAVPSLYFEQLLLQ